MQERRKYNLYIDESGDADLYSGRWLCLCGIVLEDEYATNNMPCQFDKFKQKYNIENTVLHLEDIKRNRKNFGFLSKSDNRTFFYNDLALLLKNLTFDIIAVVIDKSYHRKKYITPHDPYHYALKIIVENFSSYLYQKSGLGKVYAESRNGTLDLLLSDYFSQIYDNGTFYAGCTNHGPRNYSAKAIQRITSRKIKFFNKENTIKYKVNGLEIADLLCNPVMQIIKRHIHEYDVKKQRDLIQLRKTNYFEKNILEEEVINPRKFFFGWKP